MTNLLWPGDHRAGQYFTDSAVCLAMVDVENAWLEALRRNTILPAQAAPCDLRTLITDADLDVIAEEAEDGANPAIPLVALLRQRAPESTRQWIHRGLTSQDVIDSALILTLRAGLNRLRLDLAAQLGSLADLAHTHRRTPTVARTLTQPAIPTTFGVKAAVWLDTVCDAAEAVERLRTPAQIGGAAGTLAAPTEMAALLHGRGRAVDVAFALADDTAHILGLDSQVPWHTSRAPITAAGDALVGCTDAWGRIAADILTLGRPEIGELSEARVQGRGGSSTMPDKNNPVLSVLLRRTALTAPPLAATLHTAAALNNDERPDGAWHAEWDTLRILGRRTLVAASHASDLLTGLRIKPASMSANLTAVDISGEQRAIASLVGLNPTPDYFGASEALIDAAIGRANGLLERLT
ncbi:lyase family protein [Mycolicibacterium phocaicum]|uniref:3-carboxy-cis,cis-muconate cycloisomerase n=1 Tax=Mycolicibacterium phocaicum TaxID=319706 RepID=A0A7I7ZVV3_9MYCO|nr:lyase family protein [Mycolicibacterium phocaicum]TLH64028.1 3-carboxy-cis,cis-muconate cycloisomerase [Mycolicibacterium phocaicum]BBZ58110.1 3-carboxy-cis,cis-muconate cycloisomerase [Mycolicibacterium phocaicum]